MKIFALPKSRRLGLMMMCALSFIISTGPADAQDKPIALEEILDPPANETFPAGIVYGPKAAFNIRAPEGWVLDNRAGVSQGLPCVLYPKGSTWADADAVMYAKIASTDTTD